MVSVLTSSTCTLCHSPVESPEICRLSFARIVQCSECGLVRTWPPRTPEQLAALHADPSYFRHPYFEARRDVGRDGLRTKHRRVLELLTHHQRRPGQRLLDVGCDTGSLLAVTREEFGMEVVGLEVSPEAAETARREHGLDVRVGGVAEADLPPESFDFITLVDVIEHVSDPGALLGQLRGLLRPGGKLYIATLDHDALINSIGLIFYRWLGRRSWSILEKLYIPYHEFYFTRTTLDRLVRQSGLVPVSHLNREFPLDEFGHGLLLKCGLIPIFGLQRLLKRQTLQEMIATRDDG